MIYLKLANCETSLNFECTKTVLSALLMTEINGSLGKLARSSQIYKKKIQSIWLINCISSHLAIYLMRSARMRVPRLYYAMASHEVNIITRGQWCHTRSMASHEVNIITRGQWRHTRSISSQEVNGAT